MFGLTLFYYNIVEEKSLTSIEQNNIIQELGFLIDYFAQSQFPKTNQRF